MSVVCARRSNVPVRIDGTTYWSIHDAYIEAKRRGFDGGEAGFYLRVRRARELTWVSLGKPIAIADHKRSSARAETQRAKRAEMAAVIAALDARKAGIA